MEAFDQLHSYKPIKRCFRISNAINVAVGVLGILSAVLSSVAFASGETKTGLIALICGLVAVITSVVNYFFIKLVFSVFHNLFWTRENLDYLVRRINARASSKSEESARAYGEKSENAENSTAV